MDASNPSYCAICICKKYRFLNPNKGIYLGSMFQMPKDCQKRLGLSSKAFLVTDKSSFHTLHGSVRYSRLGLITLSPLPTTFLLSMLRFCSFWSLYPFFTGCLHFLFSPI